MHPASDPALDRDSPGPLILQPAVTFCWWSGSGSDGVVSPQDTLSTERDVRENYNLHRPQTLDRSLASSPASLQGGGLQKHKLGIYVVLEGGREAEVLITYVKVSFVRE